MTKKKDFDPVKKVIGGEQAEAIVWTTNSLNAAVEAIKKGLPLKANPFIGKDILLLKPDLVYERTQEEIDDYIHCMNDVVYFASKCKLMTPKGLDYVTLRDYQEDYLRHVSKNRFSIWLACRQAGKCFLLLNNINICINFSFLTDYLLRKYDNYVDKDMCYITLPMFELQNLFDNSLIWKLKYYLYRILSWQERKGKKETYIMKIVNNVKSTIIKISQSILKKK